MDIPKKIGRRLCVNMLRWGCGVGEHGLYTFLEADRLEGGIYWL